MVARGPAVALVTSEAHPNLTADDRILAQALEAVGFSPVPRRWDASAESWEDFHAVILRSCWDYHRRAVEFLGWLDDMERRDVRVFNRVSTVRWNARKTYLQDLAAAGIPVVPTAWVGRGEDARLAGVMHEHHWRRVVVKPTISATAFHTWPAGPDVSDAEEERFATLLAERDLMVQPFVEAIATDGELSFMFFGERFSHAVVKRARPGDFRVQEDFGGTVTSVQPASQLVEAAGRVVAAAPGSLLYARVDGCVVDGRLLVMELEVIEPSLFFGRAPAAADMFVEALRARLKAGSREPGSRPAERCHEPGACG